MTDKAICCKHLHAPLKRTVPDILSHKSINQLVTNHKYFCFLNLFVFFSRHDDATNRLLNAKIETDEDFVAIVPLVYTVRPRRNRTLNQWNAACEQVVGCMTIIIIYHEV